MMKRNLPMILMFLFAVFAIFAYFVPEKHVYQIDTLMRNKFLVIVGIFALILGIGSLFQYHYNKIRHRKEYWRYSILTMVTMILTSLIGIFGGISAEGPLPTKIFGFPFDIQALFNGIVVPLGASMFALLAFFMSSAAYRAFRARNVDAAILLIAAIIVMLGQIPVGTWAFPELFDVRQWLLDVPNMAAKRAIKIGVALGVIGTSLKIIFGIERSWLGGGSD
jgi:hypothetical protein